MVVAFQPVRGISADHVTNIPEQWSKQWFRGFIRNHLEQMDVRNAVPGPGIAITSAAAANSHTLLARGKISVGGAGGVPLNTLAPQTAFTFVANNTAASASPTEVNGAGATSMLNLFSPALKGLVPASGGGTANFLRADGAWVVPAYPVGANPSASVGLTAVPGIAATYLRSDGAPALDQSISPTWSGNHKFNNPIGVNGNTGPAQVTGFGTPTGTGVIANFPGATATLAQATQAIAQMIADLKAIGFYGT